MEGGRPQLTNLGDHSQLQRASDADLDRGQSPVLRLPFSSTNMAEGATASHSPAFAGVLDVHIIEALDLPGSKKLKSDKLNPYVVCRLESKRDEKHSTLPAKPVRVIPNRHLS